MGRDSVEPKLKIRMSDLGRKNPSPGVHIKHGSPNLVLLTVTTAKRLPWLANEEAHGCLRTVWQDAAACLVGDYLLMPDHLHLICAPFDPSVSIEHWITYWKREFRRMHTHSDWRFQSRGWHHRLRDGESYTEKWHYVRMNPVRKGLVMNPETWTFKGRIHDLIWTG